MSELLKNLSKKIDELAETPGSFKSEFYESPHQEAEKVDIESIKSQANFDLYKKIVEKQIKDEGDEEKAQLLKLSEDILVQHYQDYKKEFSTEYYKAGGEGNLSDKFSFEMQSIAKQMGVIDKYDNKVLKKIIEDATYVPPFQRTSLLHGLKEGFINQIEGVQFAGIAAIAAIKGDTAYYGQRAGGEMAEKGSDLKWSEVLTDLMFLGPTGSERGGKMFSADLLFLLTGGFGYVARPLLGGITKATVKTISKQTGKVVAKTSAKKMTQEAITAALREGAKLELTGYGKNVATKEINKLATSIATQKLKDQGVKAGSKVLTQAIEKERINLIVNGIEGAAGRNIMLKNLGKSTLDLINVPMNLSTRELAKGLMGYGNPVLSGMTEGFRDTAAWILQSPTKLTQLYAQHNITQYERDLANEFYKNTGYHPLDATEDELVDAWNAYKEFKISNEGMMTILTGEKEGWGRFGNFAVDSILGMGGIMIGTSALRGGISKLGGALKVSGDSKVKIDLNNLYKQLETDKANVDKIKQDIENYTIGKQNIIEEVKMVNRSNELLNNIINKSLDDINLTPEMRETIIKVENLNKEIKSANIADQPKLFDKLSLEINNLLKNIEVRENAFSINKDRTELNKIVDYFNKMENQIDFTNELRLATIKNLSRGSSVEVRNMLGGMTAAEVMASGNPYITKYFINQALRSSEIAKRAYDNLVIDTKASKFITDMAKVSDKVENNAFMSAIKGAVEGMVKDQLSGLGVEETSKVSRAIVGEGITKVLEVYNTVSRVADGELGGIDYKNFVGGVLSETFGSDMLKSLSKGSNISEFLKTLESQSPEKLSKLFKGAFKSNKIFAKDENGKFIEAERYRRLEKDLREKVRVIAESQKAASDKYFLKLAEINTIRSEYENSKLLSIDNGEYNAGRIRTNNKEYIPNGKALQGEYERQVVNKVNQSVEDTKVIPRNTITPSDVEKLKAEYFGKIDILKNEVMENFAEYSNVHINALTKAIGLPEDLKRITSEMDLESRIGVDPDDIDVNSSDVNINMTIQQLKQISEMLPVSNAVKSSHINKVAKVYTAHRAKKILIDDPLGTKSDVSLAENILKKLDDESEVAKLNIELNKAEIAKITAFAEKMENYLGELSKKLKIDENELIKNLSPERESIIKQIIEDKRVEMVKSEADLDLQIKILEKEANAIDKYINNIRKYEELAKEITKDENILTKDLEDKAYWERTMQEAEYIHRDLIGELYQLRENVDFFGRVHLSEIAKSSEDVQSFYKNLENEWIRIYGRDAKLPRELMNPDGKNYYALYSNLNQMKFEYNDGTPIQKTTISFTQTRIPTADGKGMVSKWTPQVEYTSAPVGPDGTVIPIGKGATPLDIKSEANGYKIYENAGWEYGGKNSSIVNIISAFVKNEEYLKKNYESPSKVITQQDKVLYATAEKMSGKSNIAVVSNMNEIINALSGSGLEITVGGKNYTYNFERKVGKDGATLSQMSTDAVEVNTYLTRMIYNEFLKPIATEMEKQGKVLLGSLNEEGSRLFSTDIKDNDLNKTFNNYYKNVLNFDLNTSEGIKGLKRLKLDGTNDNHLDIGMVNRMYKELGLNRKTDKDGNVMFRAIVADDESAYKASSKAMDGDKYVTVTTAAGDGSIPTSPIALKVMAKLSGNDPNSITLKPAAYVDGKVPAYLKGLFRKMDRVYYDENPSIKSIVDGDKVQSYDQLIKDYDFVWTKSNIKYITDKAYKAGDIIDINVQDLRIKSWKTDLTTERSYPYQNTTAFPHKLLGESTEAKAYNKAKEVFDNKMLEIRETELRKFIRMVNEIQEDPTNVHDVILRFYNKDIAASEFMSTKITDIARGGGLKNNNKALFDEILNAIYRENITRAKVRGTQSIIIDAPDINKLSKVIEQKYGHQGVTKDNFIVLEKKHYKDLVAYDENGYAYVITHRYPVNTPVNTTYNRVVWAENVREHVGDIGNRSIINHMTVAIRQQGDFDGDKIDIISDPRFIKELKALTEASGNVKEFNIVVDLKNEKSVPNIYDFALDGFTDEKGMPIPEGYRNEAKKLLNTEMDTISKMYKIKSKYTDLKGTNLNKFVTDLRNSLERKDSKNISFVEKFISSDEWNKLKDIKLDSEIEKAATRYASGSIKNLIPNDLKKDVTNHNIIKEYNSINDEFSVKMALINDAMDPYRVAPKGLKYPTISSKTLKPINYVGDIKLINYHESLLRSIDNQISIERKVSSGLTSKTEKDKSKVSISNLYNLRDGVNQRINDLNNELSRLRKLQNSTIKTAEADAMRTVAPLIASVKDEALRLNIQRELLSLSWGTKNNVNVKKDINMEAKPRVANKPFFLINDSEPHKEFIAMYNSEYSIKLMESRFGGLNEFTVNRIREFHKSPKATPAERQAAANDLTKVLLDDINVDNRILTTEDLARMGRVGELLNEILFDPMKRSIASKTGIDASKVNLGKTVLRVIDLEIIQKDTSDLFDSHIKKVAVIKDSAQTIAKNITETNQALYKELSKPVKTNTTDMKIRGLRNKLKTHISEYIVKEFVDTKRKEKAIAATAQSSLKNGMVVKSDITKLEKEAKSLEYQKNKIVKELQNTRSQADIAKLSGDFVDVMTGLQRSIIELSRLVDKNNESVKLSEIKEQIKEKSVKAFSNFFLDYSKKYINSLKTRAIKNFDAVTEIKKVSDLTNKEVQKLADLAPTDFLSQLFQTATKTYKNMSVGIAAGRIMIESVNNGITTLSAAAKYMRNVQFTDKRIEAMFKSKVKNFRIPKPGDFDAKIFQDWDRKGVSGTSKNKTLKTIEKVTGTAAGKVGWFVNLPSTKMAQAYHNMKFREFLVKEAGKTDLYREGKTFLFEDPKNLSFQKQRSYYNTMNYLNRMANSEVEKAFFNYDMNPLIAHKMETVLPFTNFMFSGMRLMSKYPRTILGIASVFQNYVNNYGDQVMFVMDDEDGDPIRVDYGKRLKMGILGAYGGITVNLDRLLQFSPTDAGISAAPIFSYLTGDSDWRVKKYIDGEMSLLELGVGAISPSISQLATGIYEDDYQKRWNGMSYLFTGWATKSTAHQDMAKAFFWDNDYQRVLDAPKGLRNSFYKKTFKGKMDDAGIIAHIEAQKLGLINFSGNRNEFGIYARENAFKDAVRTWSQLSALAADGLKDEFMTDEFYKDMARDSYELMKHVVGKTFFENLGEEDWLDRVIEFVENGHLDSFAKTNPAYAESMRHFYEQRDYYSKKYELQGRAYSEDSTEEEQMRARAGLLALNYDIAGAGSNYDNKVRALLNGEVQFLVDDEGFPKLTKEREAELAYRGFFFAAYEKAIEKNSLARNMRNMYLSIYHDAKKSGDKEKASNAWLTAEMYKEEIKSSLQELKEEHELIAEAYVLKNQTFITNLEASQNGFNITAPIKNYMKIRSMSLNEFYNEMANDRISFLTKNDDVGWSNLSNLQKSTFRMMNGGKTINQAREDLAHQVDTWGSIIDMNIPKNSSELINKLNLYE